MKMVTIEHLEQEMWTVGFRYSCRTMEAAAQDRDGWRQVDYRH